MPAGSRPPTRSAPFPNGGFEQVGDAGIGEDARLREGDDLQVDALSVSLLQAQQGFEPGKSDVRVDIDVAARRDRSERRQHFDQPAATRLDRRRDGAPQRFFGRDAVRDRRAFDMRNERQTDERLVEVDMAFDEAGKDQPTFGVKALRVGRRAVGGARAERRYAAVLNKQLGRRAARGERIGDDERA